MQAARWPLLGALRRLTDPVVNLRDLLARPGPAVGATDQALPGQIEKVAWNSAPGGAQVRGELFDAAVSLAGKNLHHLVDPIVQPARARMATGGWRPQSATISTLTLRAGRGTSSTVIVRTP